MNNCKICNTETKNKLYCSRTCRDAGRKIDTYEIRYCLSCGIEISVRKKANTKFCSVKCASKNIDVNTQRIISMKKTNLDRYGNENYRNIDQTKKTNLARYGNTCTFASNTVKEKIKQTNLERYGVEYPQQSDEIQLKTKTTLMEKYGGYTFQSDILVNKVKNTLMEKYNVDNPLKSNKIKNRVKETNLYKYGCEWGLSNTDIKNKVKSTIQKKYGDNITNISQVASCASKIKTKKILQSYDAVMQRIPEYIQPMFTQTDFDGVGYYNTLHKFRCKKCNQTFEQYLYAGNIPKCLNCNPIPKSKFEVDVLDFLNTIYDGTIVKSDRNVLKPKELDIYIPDKKIAIECNGNYWHSEINGMKDKNYHLNKTIKCNKQGIRLIHIFEDEWINKKNIVKNRLEHILLCSTDKIYARKCEIREITTYMKSEFLNNTHIQGTDKSNVKLGLFHNEELVSIMTFSKRKIFKNSDWELSRFASKYTVIGAAGKLLKYFIRNYNPLKIITYSDIRWNTGNIYETLSFKKTTQTPPGYFYLINNQRVNRINFQKHKLKDKLEIFNPNLTEWENMQMNGYDRIWDCGNYKYVWQSDYNF